MSAYSRSVEKGDKANPPDVGSVGTSSTLIRTFRRQSRAIRIQNRHASQNLLFSLDGGTTFETIGPFGKIDEAYRGKTLHMKGSDTGTTYDVRTTEQQ
ncbi:hypothetical protein LCGC14_1429640 [marine sediment metagenome]|uniref:Uncharacterized protein n=1 Tax=marine sediment metagenome TaxID=412755 RepID=A0A0F9MQS9_9ZZZZ